jgi:hypothetical protein
MRKGEKEGGEKERQGEIDRPKINIAQTMVEAPNSPFSFWL